MGIIPLWPFSRRKKTQPRCAIVLGNGRFTYYITSDVHQQIQLQRLFGNRANGPDYRCPALLIPRLATAWPNRVAVRIEDATVGYLHLTGAREFLAALDAFGTDRAACAAMIVARWDPALGEHTHFRVRLDAVTPFNFLELSADMAVRKQA
jgi:hypothetical protein